MTNKRKQMNLLRLMEQILNELKYVEIGTDRERQLIQEYEGFEDELNNTVDYKIRRYAYRLNRLYAVDLNKYEYDR